MKNITFFILFFTIFFQVKVFSAEIVSFDYPPYLNTKHEGIIVEIVNEISNITSRKYSLLILPRKRAIKYFRENRDSLFIGESRYFFDKKIIKCSLFQSKLVLVAKKKRWSALKFENLMELKGKKVGVSLGSNLSKNLESKGIFVEEYHRLESSLDKLILNRVDYWATTDITAHYLINRNKKSGINDFILTEFGKPFTIEVFVKENSKDIEVLNIFCKGLDKIKKNGKLDEILRVF